MGMSYRPITRSGMTALYSLAAVGTNVTPTSALAPSGSTHGVLATCCTISRWRWCVRAVYHIACSPHTHTHTHMLTHAQHAQTQSQTRACTHLPVLCVVKGCVKAHGLLVLVGDDQLRARRRHALLEDVAGPKVVVEEAEGELGLEAAAV
jgi:hypothetical protein